MDKYVVWFVGNDTEAPTCCYNGRDVYWSSSEKSAKHKARSLAKDAGLSEESYKVCKLVEVK